jgi:uncharacterized membrane protein YagU involved in acid resistance
MVLMKNRNTSFLSLVATGIAAGAVGTGIMMVVRTFDQHYAPETIAKTRKDPGAYMVNVAERATGTSRMVPQPVEKTAALGVHMGYGTLFGILYGLWRGRRRRSALADGLLLGTAVYAAGYFGWLPALGLTQPIWKQPLPEIAGGLFRHAAYGVATTGAYGAINEAL